MERGTKTPRGRCTATIVETVAETEGIDPLDLPPLHTVLDPDPLERVIESTRADVTIEFHYCGYDVTVDGTGEIRIAARTGASATPDARE